MATANSPAQQQALAQLADIQEPILGNDWYLAPGWWLLAALVLTLSWLLYRKYRQQQLKQAPRRFALKVLAALDLSATDASAQITALLKRWLLNQQPDHPALSYSGKSWQQFLLNSLPANQQTVAATLPDLLALHYQGSPQLSDVQAYASFAAYWLQHADLKLDAKQPLALQRPQASQTSTQEKTRITKGAADV